MFGKVWPVGQWAGLGAILGAVFQLIQAMNKGLFEKGPGFVVGGLLAGALLGAFAGGFLALVRNEMTRRR
jgi:hypothetical protein